MSGKTSPKAYYLGKRAEKDRRVTALEELARQLGYLNSDGSGNASGLLKAFADGSLEYTAEAKNGARLVTMKLPANPKTA